MYSIHEPSHQDHERYEEKGAPDDQPQDEQPMLPMHEFFSLIKRRAFAGSCCAGVAALYFLACWDHGLTWLPSSFVNANEITKVQKQLDEVSGKVKPLQSDVAAMYSLLLSRSIRDVWREFCSAKDPSDKRAKEDQLEILQSTYEARNHARYLLLPCRDL